MESREFVDPKYNDFQWRNLYIKQFGLCTYPPPMPKNPSTTDNAFPHRKDVHTFLGDDEFSDVSDDDMRSVTQSTVLRSRKKSSVFTLNDVMYEDAAPKRHLSNDSILEELFPKDSAFSIGFLDFLTRRRSTRNTIDYGGGSDSDQVDEFSDSQFPQGSNPNKIPKEIFSLHRDAWTLLMDNRPMAWLEREAGEKYRTASAVRHRLLELTSNADGRFDTAASVENFDTSEHHTISSEEATNRVYESFQPFFAVISKPSAVRKLKEQYMNSRDAQLKEKEGGLAADLIGIPLFSQFATWCEAYHHRVKWKCAPFSFFLIYDTSLNFAHVSAMFILLDLICKNNHHHSAHCSDYKKHIITVEETGYQMVSGANARRAIEQQQHMCPLLAMQQIAEDLFLAFEQSSSRSALTMALSVCSFLTDCVLDAETSRRFLSKESLHRQSTFVVPGMNAVPDNDEGDDRPFEASVNEGDGSTRTGGNNFSELFAFKRFSDVEFESLFELSYWFIDAATANSRIPIDCSLLPVPKNSNWAASSANIMGTSVVLSSSDLPSVSASKSPTKAHAGSGSRRRPTASSSRGSRVGASSGRLGSRGKSKSTTSTATTQSARLPTTEHTYIPGRDQQHMAVTSIVEVIALYEQQRAAFMLARAENTGDSAAAAARRKHTTRFSTRNAIMEANFSVSTTFLATPLIFISSYIRLHGAPWLKHLLNHLCNILRRESVLLYVNRLDLDEPAGSGGDRVGSSGSGGGGGGGGGGGSSGSASGSAKPAAAIRLGVRRESDQAAPFSSYGDAGDDNGLGTLERLEDLICQDIQFVMTEFFSALYGKRSATRLPQGITSLLTLFCTQIHMHLLGNMTVTENLVERPGETALKVDEYIRVLKRKRTAAKTTRGGESTSDSSITKLISSIEQCRMAKFLLFDCWIIPALNNAVQSGYISANSPLHLRWNIDAFARYLKILVNSPFVDADQPLAVYPEVPTREKGFKTRPPPIVTIPRFITGIYDVSSGTLVRLVPQAYASTKKSFLFGPTASLDLSVGLPPLRVDEALAGGNTGNGRSRGFRGGRGNDFGSVSSGATPSQTVAGDGASAEVSRPASGGSAGARPGSNVSGGRPGSGRGPQGKGGQRQQQDTPPQITEAERLQRLAQSLEIKTAFYKSMETASWEQLSSSIQGLNETLGIKGYDPLNDADTFVSVDTGTKSVMHVLDLFCKRSSVETASNVVVTEFEVLPSMAAGCVEKLYEFVTGAHPLVEQALAARIVPCKYNLSPYLACLNGVLLHPRVAATALDNVYYNNKAFYQALMRPLKDKALLEMLTSLLAQNDELPMVDCNAVLPYVSALPPLNKTKLRAANEVQANRHLTEEEAKDAELVHRWESAVRRLRRQQGFLTTGAVRGKKLSYEKVLESQGPSNPLDVLHAGSEAIEEAVGIVPLCFDPWWRAMTAAISVKVISVLAECSPNTSNNFLQWCKAHEEQATRNYKLSADAFVRHGGKEVTETIIAAEANRQRADKRKAAAATGPQKTKKKKKKTKAKGKKGAVSKNKTANKPK